MLEVISNEHAEYDESWEELVEHIMEFSSKIRAVIGSDSFRKQGVLKFRRSHKQMFSEEPVANRKGFMGINDVAVEQVNSVDIFGSLLSIKTIFEGAAVFCKTARETLFNAFVDMICLSFREGVIDPVSLSKNQLIPVFSAK